ncbi:LysR family transcriptional regulator [Advenella mimigardefordensis]|uniref:Transcriptional regulator, LysR family n=1 Tax=Advenella mimigardefordensis (strain DSM 17166 / LMG 22922 / DPN7) TaxID=1247726 RepID=W0P9R1_ADVMD|nr:LysR family transcriptional regulator [Advenella mimigardefordensis]AHG63471.1 transcriptional regulator, LysR family [Advenella mimigardefordensis DPN7]
MLIDLAQLRTFVGVAEEEHLTRAAERLHMSQSAASAHVRAIEENLDIELFIRTNRSLKLTTAGELLLERARDLLNEANAFTSFARELRGKIEGALVVSSSSDPSISRVAQIVAAMHRMHPLVKIDLRARQSAGTRQELKTGELDVGVMLGPSLDPGLIHYELTKITFRIVGPIDWKEQIENADWKALAAMPWIAPMDSSKAYSDMLAGLFETRGLKPNTAVRFDNSSLARSMLLSGMGLMLMREEHALEDEKSGILAIAPLGITQLPLFIAHQVCRKNDPLIVAFMEAARQVWPGIKPTVE